MEKAALVTGGAIRIGRALSLGLAEAGYDIVVHFRSSEEAAKEVARRVEALGRRAVLARGDLSLAEDAQRVVDEASTELGRLDLLVNSAASFRARAIEEVDAAEWDAVMSLNLRGPFLVAKASWDLLRRARGSIVNIVDLSALQAWSGYPHHSVSKAGLLHLTRVLALGMAPHVRVNAVAPGAVLPPDDYSDEERERLRMKAPLQTLGSPQDVVRTVLFLASSPFITGDVVVVDGGSHLSF